ncbi:MAG: peptidase [Ectothiorhodospiraceae bacterium]|nr:peptidase [Ectothiorhodospiraceae bacterium]
MFRKQFSTPTVFVLLVFSVFLGSQIRAISEDSVYEQMRKFQDVLSYTQKYYVDEVKVGDLVESAVKGLLEDLDPHSVYIPPKQLEKVEEDFQGSFEGIGIQFNILNDTIRVVTPINGGPSEKAGLQSGDKIVEIDGESAVGFSNDDVQKHLRGEKGTEVTVGVQRAGVKGLIDFTIIRDNIPLYAVDTYFMLDDGIGYMSVNRYSATTYKEFVEGLRDLKKQGMKKFVLDLRYNPGGYLEQAWRMANEFLAKGDMIVYTKGRRTELDDDYVANGAGEFQDVPLIVLINQGSASASEIVSGAVQDHDRGLVVGRTSFGKGLVQQQFPLSDGSAFRLTTAKYYTPSGRLIQRDYEGKSDEEYYMDIRNRDEEEGDNVMHTMEHIDSTRPRFETTGGRTVYGGGGITPDYIVDAGQLEEYTAKLRANMYPFILSYMDKNGPELRERYGKDDADRFLKEFKVTESLIQSLVEHGESKGVEMNEEQFEKDKTYIRVMLKAQLARNLFGNEGFYRATLEADPQFLKAISLFPEAEKIAGLK